jgi:hypothetical protein
MKTKIGILVFALLAVLCNLQAQDRITANAVSYDISDNLDLQAVATLFGKSKNLENFEQRLNDPRSQISNLDLNQDGYVDYLRVMENADNGNSEVVIQAVLGDNVFQDVATIDVEKDNSENPAIQIIGDPYLYGPDYILLPVFVRRPLIFSFFWGSAYRPWHSPFYWGYYPPRFQSWRPMATFKYQRNVHRYISYKNTYNFTTVRRFNNPAIGHDNFRRNDYATKYPGGSFNQRHAEVKNKLELNQRRPSNAGNNAGKNVDRQIQNQRPQPAKNNQETKVIERRRPVSGPQTNPVSAPKRPVNQIGTSNDKLVSPGKTKTVINRKRTEIKATPKQQTVKKSVITTDETKRKTRKERRAEEKK